MTVGHHIRFLQAEIRRCAQRFFIATSADGVKFIDAVLLLGETRHDGAVPRELCDPFGASRSAEHLHFVVSLHDVQGFEVEPTVVALRKDMPESRGRGPEHRGSEVALRVLGM